MSCFTDKLDLTERGKVIIDKVIAERLLKIGDRTFLLSHLVGENQILEPTPEVLEIWRKEVVDEALRRMNEADMALYRGNQ